MNIDKNQYKKYASAHAPKSPVLRNCLYAFFVGGAICALGQGLADLYSSLGVVAGDAATLSSITLIFLSVSLTAIGVFDKIAKWAGAGTLVPITGFANAVSSAAIDNKGEGFVLGVGAKIFTIAGPVILYGIAAGAVYGMIYWVTTLF